MIDVYISQILAQIFDKIIKRMINKSEWSLTTHTEKDINRCIVQIKPVPHSQAQFTKLMTLKESHQQSGVIPKPEQILQVLNAKSKKRKEQQSSDLCSICFMPVTSNKYWCRICGNLTCKTCLVRERQLKDETIVPCCQKCDSQWLSSMSQIKFYNKVQKLHKCLDLLVREQQGIQMLVNLQKDKLMKQATNPQTADLIKKTNKCQGLREKNKGVRADNQQLQKKIQFGKKMNQNLRNNLKQLRKKRNQSFGSESNPDSLQPYLQHSQLQAQLDMSFDNIRASVLTTANFEPEQGKTLLDKCKCQIY